MERGEWKLGKGKRKMIFRPFFKYFFLTEYHYLSMPTKEYISNLENMAFMPGTFFITLPGPPFIVLQIYSPTLYIFLSQVLN